MRIALIALLLAACSDPEATCQAAADQTDFQIASPHGSTPGSVTARFADGLDGPDLALFLDGEPVEGSTHPESGTLTFAPDANLLDDRVYEARFTATCTDGWSGREWPVTVTEELWTEPFVQPVSDPAALDGAVFASPGDTFYVVRPDSSTGGALVPWLHMVWLPMLRLDDLEGGTASLIWTSQDDADFPGQKPCTVPVAVEATFTNPRLVLDAERIEVQTGVGSVDLYDFRLEARISQDGARLGRASAEARFDMRDLYEELGYDSFTSLCDNMAELGASCGPCPDGPRACMEIHLAGFEGQVDDEVAIRDEDLCGVEGQLALWTPNAVFRAEPGGTVVHRVGLDGQVQWSTDLGMAIAALTLESSEPDSEIRATIALSNGTNGFWLLDRATGEATYIGGHRGAGLGMIDFVFDVFSSLTVHSLGCSTTGPQPGGFLAFLVALVAVRRRP